MIKLKDGINVNILKKYKFFTINQYDLIYEDEYKEYAFRSGEEACIYVALKNNQYQVEVNFGINSYFDAKAISEKLVELAQNKIIEYVKEN